MKLLTDAQKEFFIKKKLKLNRLYTIPDFSFYVYTKPQYGSGELIVVPEGKTTQGTLLRLTEIGDDFVGGYLTKGEYLKLYYFERYDIEYRIMLETIFLYMFCFVPFVIYNLSKKIYQCTLRK